MGCDKYFYKKKPKSEIFEKVKYKICNISKKKNLEKKINEKFDYVVNLGGYVDHKNKKKTREKPLFEVAELS